MAFEEILRGISLPASADLSGNQFYFIYIDTNGRIALPSTANRDVLGVLNDKPNALGRAGDVTVGGVVKVMSGGAVAIGDFVTNDNTGKGVTATGGQKAHGICITGCAATGQLISVLLGGPRGTV